jgi:hypothetical protein
MKYHLQSNQRKWTGGVDQVVECLLCKCEALKTNPRSTPKIKEVAIVVRLFLLTDLL